MKPVLIFRHIDCEGPGYFAEVLEHYTIPFRLVCIDQGETPPADIDAASALVFMGGSMSVNDPLPWIARELALIRQAAERGMPVLGHCLGGQLISKALGGTVGPNPVQEIGWLPVQTIPSPAADDWLAGIDSENTVFHWHGETFSIPEGATTILKSRHCPQQGFVLGNTLALQCHIEMTADMVREWSRLYQHELSQVSETVQGASQLQEDLDSRIQALQVIADVLYRRWLRPLLT